MKFRNRYSDSKRVSIKFDDPSLTDQSFKDECDLGFIIENYVSKGIPLPQSTMNYADCTTVPQYEEAMQIVAEAKSNFEQLPSKDRDRFKTVENFLAFISDSSNLKESYEKGYIDPSSVDLKDIYSDSVNSSNSVNESSLQESQNSVSVTPSTESAE